MSLAGVRRRGYATSMKRRLEELIKRYGTIALWTYLALGSSGTHHDEALEAIAVLEAAPR